jgi:uncharacterized protein (DUF433 family)
MMEETVMSIADLKYPLDEQSLGELIALVERIRYGKLLLRECIECDPDLRSGVPVLRGTRFTVAHILGELAEGRSLAEIAKAFRLDAEQLRKLLESLAILVDRPAVP